MKQKLLLLLFSLGLSIKLVAYDFSTCQIKAVHSMEKIDQSYGIAIKPLKKNAKLPAKSVLFFYSPNTTPKDYKILKHDPFLGFYLLESKTNLNPISLKEINSEMLEDEIASITPTHSVSGKIMTRMQSPVDFATLNVPTFQNSLINTICDQNYGIGIGKNQFLEKNNLTF